jgi:speckle-type POZ protein
METQEISNNSAPLTQSEQTPTISSVSTTYLCQTEGVVNEIDFKWKIERLAFFGNLIGMGWERLISGEFSDSKLKLDLNPSSEYLDFRLFHSSINLNYPIVVEITVCDENCKTIFQKTSGILVHSIVPAVVLRITKKSLLETENFANGRTTIHCKIKSLNRRQRMGKTTATRDSDKPDLILGQLEELFEKMPLSDVTFIIRGQTFSAHKAILAMRSPVFAAMFLHPTKEMQSGKVEVEDIDPDVFQEVLRYLYSGLTRSTAMEVMATGLLVAADKYLLDELKTRCETHLIRKMSAKNCMDMLALTTHNPAEYLKKFAIEYFRRNPSKLTLK